MAKGFKAGAGGGTALNFKVVGNPQPASPKENTIWLNADVPIGAWYFSATQPENLNEGDVWFPIGTSSPVEFNALKKNGIQVYPLSAKQYVGGALVDVDTQIYQSGEWGELVSTVWLYDNGVKHVAWESAGVNMEERTDCLYMQTSAVGDGYWVTTDSVRIANNDDRKLFANVARTGGGANKLWIGLVASKTDTTPVACIDLTSTAITGICETELGNIPDGEYYVKIYLNVSTGNIAYLSVFQLYIAKEEQT